MDVFNALLEPPLYSIKRYESMSSVHIFESDHICAQSSKIRILDKLTSLLVMNIDRMCEFINHMSNKLSVK